MKSYTILRDLYGVDTKNTSAANLLYGDQMMNDFLRRLLSKADWPFLHRLRTVNTVASTSFVNLPYDVDLIESVFVTVSSTRYSPKNAPSRAFWDKLHYSSYNSDIPEYWFVYNGQIGLWPQPSTSDNVISINAKILVPDLAVADLTTSTITTLANGSTALTVNAGLTAQMAGFWIRPTLTSTANTGDGRWYEISAVASATAGTLVRGYGGNSIAAGTAACTISQMPVLPEAFHDLPEIYAAYRYWSKEKDSRADDFKVMLTERTSDLMKEYGANDLSMILDDGEDGYMINPNLTIEL